MPYFLKALGLIGTAAMIWVGGGIVVHGFETYGLGGLGHLIHDAAETAAHSLPAAGGVVQWLVEATGAGLAGIAIGLVTIPAISYCIAPIWRRFKPGNPRALAADPGFRARNSASAFRRR